MSPCTELLEAGRAEDHSRASGLVDLLADEFGRVDAEMVRRV